MTNLDIAIARLCTLIKGCNIDVTVDVPIIQDIVRLLQSECRIRTEQAPSASKVAEKVKPDADFFPTNRQNGVSARTYTAVRLMAANRARSGVIASEICAKRAVEDTDALIAELSK